jgi:hypothetical protein
MLGLHLNRPPGVYGSVGNPVVLGISRWRQTLVVGAALTAVVEALDVVEDVCFDLGSSDIGTTTPLIGFKLS